MKNILIVNNGTYGAKEGGGTIADISEANLLAAGAFAIFSSNGTLIPAASTPADLVGVNELIFASGTSGITNNISVPIPVKTIFHKDKKTPVAYVKQVVSVGGSGSGQEIVLSDMDEGELFVNVYDKAFTNKYPMDSVKASVYKTGSMTASVAIDKIVEKLNNPASFVTATKVANGSAWRITITPKENNISLSIGVGGLIENTPVFYDGTNGSTLPVFGVGQGIDVAKIEKDFNVFKGDGGYEERASDWWKVPTETVLTNQYVMYNLMWEGLHDTPTTTKRVMNNHIMVAVVNSGTAVVAALDALFDALDGVEELP